MIRKVDPSIKEAQDKAAEHYVLGITPTTNGQTTTAIPQTPNQPTTTTNQPTTAQQQELATQKFNAIEKEFGSYTEYYKQSNNQHIPGFEYQGFKKLKEEKLKREYEQVQEGKLDKDEFLLSNYGYDIMESQYGASVKSAGYWYNKIMNNDSYNPLSNEFFMSAVLDQARTQLYKESFINQINSFTAEDSTALEVAMASDQKITADQLSVFFQHQFKGFEAEANFYTSILDAYTRMGSATYLDPNTKEARQFDPLIRDQDNNVIAYLHKDGEIYRVSDDQSALATGDRTFHVKYRAGTENTTKEVISLQDDSGVISTIRSISAGALGVLADIGALGYTIAGGLIKTILTGEFGKSFGDAYGEAEEFKNSLAALDHGYVDMDQDSISLLDVTTTVGSVFGAIAGMYIIGAAGQGATTIGSRMAQSTLTSGLGKATTLAGNTMTRLSQLYTGTSKVAGPIGNNVTRAALKKSVYWSHLKLVGTYFTKDLVDNFSYQNMRYDNDPVYRESVLEKHPDDPRWAMFGNSIIGATTNAIISGFLTGGVDDSPSRRFQLFFTKDDPKSVSHLLKYFSGNSKRRVWLDGAMDFVDNLFTMSVDNAIKSGADLTKGEWGKVLQTMDPSKNPRLTFQSMVMAGQTMKGSARRGFSIAGEVFSHSAPEIQKLLDAEIANAKDPNKVAALTALKNMAEENRRNALLADDKLDLIDYGKGKEQNKQTTEALKGENNSIEGSQAFADAVYIETILNNSSSTLITDVLDKTSISVKAQIYREIYTKAMENRQVVIENAQKTFRSFFTNSARSLTNKMFYNYKATNAKAFDAIKGYYNKTMSTNYSDAAFIDRILNSEMFQALNEVEKLPGYEEGSKYAGELEKVSKPLQTGDPVYNEFGDEYVVFEITADNKPDQPVSEAIKAVELIESLSPDVKTYSKDSKTYFGIRAQGPESITTAKSLGNIVAALVKIKADMTGDDVEALALSIFPNIDPKKKMQVADAVISTLEHLTSTNILTKKQASLMLTKYAADGDRATTLTYMPKERKNLPVYKYYESLQKFEKANVLLTSGVSFSAEDTKATKIATLRNIIKPFFSGDNLDADLEDILRDFPEYRTLLLEAKKTLDNVDPTKLHQGQKITSEVKKSTKEKIGKLFGKKYNDQQIAEVIPNNNPNKVTIRLGNIKDGTLLTKGERELLSHDISIASAPLSARQVAEGPASDIYSPQKLAKELRAKQRLLKEFEANGHITYDINKLDSLSRDLGYQNVQEFLGTNGVINYQGEPLGIKLELTTEGKKKIKSSRPNIITKRLTGDDATRATAINNSKGLAYIDPETTQISIKEYDIFPIEAPTPNRDSNVAKDTFINELVGYETTESKVKASVKGSASGFSASNGYTSITFRGDYDTPMYRAVAFRDLLHQMQKIDAPFRVPQEQVASYFEAAHLNPTRQDMRSFAPYFKIWDVKKNDDGSLTFTLNKEKLQATIDEVESGKFKATDRFRYIPLIASDKDPSAPTFRNKSGKDLFTVRAENNTELSLINVLAGYESRLNPELNALGDIMSSEYVDTFGYTFNVPKLSATSTLNKYSSEISAALAKDPKNIFLLSKLREIEMLNKMAEISTEYFGTPAVAKLVTDKIYSTIIATSSSAEEAFSLLPKQKTAPFSKEAKEKESPTFLVDHEDDRQNVVATRTTLDSYEIRNNIKGITLEDVEKARDILLRGKSDYVEANAQMTLVDADIAGLKAFLNDDGEYYVPVDRIAYLSDKELKFIKEYTADKHKKEIDTYSKMYGKTKEVKMLQDELVQYLSTSDATTYRQSGTTTTKGATAMSKNRLENVEELHNLKNFLLNSPSKSSLANNYLNRDSDHSLGSRINGMLMEKLNPLEIRDVQTVQTYDTNTEAGRQMLANHLAHVYEGLEGVLLSGGTTLTPEIEDNIMDSAFDIVANSKGTYFWHQHKNAFFIDDEGRIHSYARSKDIDFDKVILSTEELLGKKLILPQEGTFEGMTRPVLEVVDMNEDTLLNYQHNALNRALEDYERTKQVTINRTPEEIKRAIEWRYASPITQEDMFRPTLQKARSFGMDDATIKYIFGDDLLDRADVRYTAEEHDIKMTREAVLGPDKGEGLSDKEAALVYGERRTEKEKKRIASALKRITKKETSHGAKLAIENDSVKITKDDLNDLTIEFIKKHADDPAMIKYLTDPNATLELQSKQIVDYDLSDDFVSFDIETFMGKPFQAASTVAKFTDNKYDPEYSTIRYDYDSFSEQELDIMYKLANNVRLSSDEITFMGDEYKDLIDFAKKNEGYRKALTDFLNSKTTDMDKLKGDLDNRLVIGYNTKEADFKWLFESGIIDEEFFNRLLDNSIDVYNDLVMRYGISAGESTSRKNLGVFADLLTDIYPELKGRLSHDALADTEVTAYLFKHIVDDISEDKTYFLRNKIALEYNKLLDNQKMSGDYSAIDKLKKEFRDLAKVIDNNYDNSDVNIRQLIDRYNSWNMEIDQERNQRLLTNLIYQEAAISKDTLRNIKNGYGDRLAKLFSFIYNALPGPDGPLPPEELEYFDTNRGTRANTILFRALFPEDSPFNNRVLEEAVKPEHYHNPEVFERIALSLSEQGSEMSAKDVQDSYMKAGDLGTYVNTTDWKELDIKDAIVMGDYLKLRDKIASNAKHLGLTDNNDIQDFVDVMSAAYGKTKIAEDLYPGINFESRQVKDLIDMIIRVADKVPVEGSYNMVTHKELIHKDNGLGIGTIQVNERLLKSIGVEVDGTWYVVLSRYPHVVAGTNIKFMEAEPIKSKGIRMHEITAKGMQGDLDGDFLTLYKASSKAEGRYLAFVAGVQNRALNDANNILTKALDYAKDYSMPREDSYNEKMKLLSSPEFLKRVEKDIKAINNATTDNRRQVYEQKMKYYEELDVEPFHVVTYESRDKNFYKVFDANPFGPNDVDNRGNFVKQSLAYKNFGTFVTTIIGSLNKSQLYNYTEYGIPLKEMDRSSLRLTDNLKAILENALHKAFTTNDTEYLDSLGLKAPKDLEDLDSIIESSIDKIVGDIRQRELDFLSDETTNKMFIKEVKKFINDPEFKSEYQTNLERIEIAYKELNDAGMFKSFDYASRVSGKGVEEILIEHFLLNARSELGLESNIKGVPTVDAQKANIILVDNKEDKIFSEQDSSYISDEFYNKLKIYKENSYVVDPKVAKKIEGKKTFTTIDGEKVTAPIKLSKENVKKIGGKYYISYTERDISSTIKTSNLKTTASKLTKAEKKNFKKFFDAGADIIVDKSLYEKRGGQLHDSQMKIVKIDGKEYTMLTNFNTTVIAGDSFFDIKNKRSIGSNNEIQSVLNSPQAVWLLGDMIASVDENNKLTFDTRRVSTLLDNIRGLKKPPALQEVNAYYKLQMMQALALSNLIKEHLPDTYKRGSKILNSRAIMLNKDWGTQNGKAKINGLMETLVKGVSTSENYDAKFEDLIKDNPFLERLFTPDVELGVSFDRMISDLQDLDGTPMVSKSVKDLDKTPGRIESTVGQEQSRAKSGIVSNYRTYGTMPMYSLYRNVFDTYVDMKNMERLALNNKSNIEHLVELGYPDNFRSVSAHLIDNIEKEAAHRLTEITDPKTGHEGVTSYESKIHLDPRRKLNMEPETENIADRFSIESPTGIYKQEVDLKDVPLGDNDEANVNSFSARAKIEMLKSLTPARVLKGIVKEMSMLQDKSDYGINKAFDSSNILDNILYKTSTDRVVLENDGIDTKRIYTATEGTLEEINKEISKKRFSPYNRDKEMANKLAGNDVMELYNYRNSMMEGDYFDKFIEDFGKNLDFSEAVPSSKKDYKAFESLNENIFAPREIEIEGGVIKKEVFSADRDAYEANLKSNLFNPAGVKYDNETAYKLNTGIPMIRMSGYKRLGELSLHINKLGMIMTDPAKAESFNRFVKAQYLALKGDKITDVDKKLFNQDMPDLEAANKIVMDFRRNESLAYNAYVNITEGLISHSDLIKKTFNEPIDTFTLLAPYVDTDYKGNPEKVRDLIRDIVYVKTSPEDILLKNTADDYLASVSSIAKRLEQAYTAKGFSDYFKTSGMISNNEVKDAMDLSTEEFTDMVNRVKFTVEHEESLPVLMEGVAKVSSAFINRLKIGETKYTKEDLIDVYSDLSKEIASDKFGDLSTEELLVAYNSTDDLTTKTQIQSVIDKKEFKAGIVSDLIKHDGALVDEMFARLAAGGKILGKNATLVDQYGREIGYNKRFHSLYRGSYEFLYKEMLYHGSSDEQRFKVNVIEEALKGNVYYGNKEISDLMNKHFYTDSTGKIQKALQKMTRKTSGYIMMNPFKLVDRMLTYTAFDIAQGLMVDPMSWKTIPETSRIMKAYLQSNGKVRDPRLEAYLLMKGMTLEQAKDFDLITKTERDPVSKFEKASGISKLNDISKTAFDFQSDFYRFALFMSTLKRFEDGDAMRYGPTYHMKEYMDKIQTQSEDEAVSMGNIVDGKARPITKEEFKAYQVVSHTYGNPGTFPLLAKKMSGLFVFNTFPLNFMRSTAGFAVGFSKALKEAMKEGDYRGIYQNVAPAGLGLAGVTMFYNLFIDHVLGNIYNMEEEEKEKYKEEQLPIAPMGTMLFGTPVVTYESFSPLGILKDMTINPIKKAYEREDFDEGMPKVAEAMFRLLGENVVGRLNPLAKIAGEVIAKKDLYGDELYDTKYEYTMIENLMRKLGGLTPLGGSFSKAIVDAYSLGKYKDEPSLNALIHGAKMGAINELGNTRAYKKDRSNFYKSRQLVSAQRAIDNNIAFPDYDTEDLFNGEIARNSSLSNNYNREHANVLYKKINKAIRMEEPVSTIYDILLSAINKEGVHPDTAHSVLNGVSLKRRLSQLKDPDKFLNSLTKTERRQLEEGLLWESVNLPGLDEINLKEKKEKLPYIKTEYTRAPYTGGWGAGSGGNPNLYYKKPYVEMRSKFNQPDMTKASFKMGIWDRYGDGRRD